MVHNSCIAFCYTFSLALFLSLSLSSLFLYSYSLNYQPNIGWEKTWHLSESLIYFFYHLCVVLKRLLILKFQWKWASFPFNIIKYYRTHFIILSLKRFLLWQMAKTLRWVRKLHMLYFNVYASRLCSSPKNVLVYKSIGFILHSISLEV